MCRSLEYSAISLIKIEQFEILLNFGDSLLLNEGIYSPVPIVNWMNLLVLFDELIFDWFFAGYPDRPSYKNGHPNSNENGANYHESA